MTLPIGKTNEQLDVRTFDCFTVCVYCGSTQTSDSMGCCGESSSHFIEAWYETNAKGHIIDDQPYEMLKNGTMIPKEI